MNIENTDQNSLALQGEGQGRGVPRKGGVNRNANTEIKKRAKSLRQNMTGSEQKLWYHLRAKRFSEYKFRRQHPISHYIVDFVCLKSILIVELDGGQHGEQNKYDNTRSLLLNSKGFRILRFWNNEVDQNMESVLHTILLTLSPTLSLKGEGEIEIAI